MGYGGNAGAGRFQPFQARQRAPRCHGPHPGGVGEQERAVGSGEERERCAVLRWARLRRAPRSPTPPGSPQVPPRLWRCCGCGSAPRGTPVCRFLTAAGLLDRVIRHWGRIHSLSTALYAELENHFPPRDNELGKPARKCHTSGMFNGKEYAQKIPREELTYLILRLLQAWKEQLSHFNQHTEHHQELPYDSLSKAMQINNMVHELKTEVETVTEKARSMGINSNSLNAMASSEAAGLSISNEANMMSDSDFIHCFSRDSNKEQSYLKILKRRIMPENSC